MGISDYLVCSRKPKQQNGIEREHIIHHLQIEGFRPVMLDNKHVILTAQTEDEKIIVIPPSILTRRNLEPPKSVMQFVANNKTNLSLFVMIGVTDTHSSLYWIKNGVLVEFVNNKLFPFVKWGIDCVYKVASLCNIKLLKTIQEKILHSPT